MLAASYWSLLGPAIEISAQGSLPAWLPPAVGFLLGGAVLWVLDKSLPHLHIGFPLEEAEGPKTSWRRARTARDRNHAAQHSGRARRRRRVRRSD